MHHPRTSPIQDPIPFYLNPPNITEAQSNHWTTFEDQDDRIRSIHRILTDIEKSMPRSFDKSNSTHVQIIGVLLQAQGYCQDLFDINLPFINHELNNALYAFGHRPMVFMLDDPQGHALNKKEIMNLAATAGPAVIIHTGAIENFVRAGRYSIYHHGHSGRVGNLLPGSKFEVDLLSDFVGFLMDLALVHDLWSVVESKLRSIRRQCGYNPKTFRGINPPKRTGVQPVLGNRHQTADSRQQTADNRQQTADSRQQTADSRQQTADNRQRLLSSRRGVHTMRRMHTI
jgi:hypothetical protein